MMGEDALIGMGQKQRNQTKGFNRECMEESLRPFARRHGPENLPWQCRGRTLWSVEMTKILLLVPGTSIYQWSGVCDKFTLPPTSDKLSTAVNSVPLIVRAVSLSTVSSSSLRERRRQMLSSRRA